MKNIVSKLLVIVIITVLIQFIMMPMSYAGFWDDIFNMGKKFIDTGKELQYETKGENGETVMKNIDLSANEMHDTINDLYNIVFSLGVVITVIVGAVIGINFMISSAEDKAKIKESLVPYIIGCVVIFGAFGIWKICIEIFSKL